jgi:hypothetical protein
MIPDEIRDRAVAFRILMAWEEGKRLDRAVSDHLPSVAGPGRNLVNELVNGVVRQRGRLDHHLLFF